MAILYGWIRLCPKTWCSLRPDETVEQEWEKAMELTKEMLSTSFKMEFWNLDDMKHLICACLSVCFSCVFPLPGYQPTEAN